MFDFLANFQVYRALGLRDRILLNLKSRIDPTLLLDGRLLGLLIGRGFLDALDALLDLLEEGRLLELVLELVVESLLCTLVRFLCFPHIIKRIAFLLFLASIDFIIQLRLELVHDLKSLIRKVGGHHVLEIVRYGREWIVQVARELRISIDEGVLRIKSLLQQVRYTRQAGQLCDG